eukprot:TRINITY_DN11455_c0_g1_i2.p1 TRINITY_DN11455_c0_g1~~TRINITY_DN11455_c0_g1_i2.p1  ORF type:complete len:506 (+),score=75.11 TRINITY_DN11455_c0_g1_i2:114-1631(+)
MWLLVGAAFLLRLFFLPLNLYRSTDFEVHRNWLAITHSLPLSKWYFEKTSEWTLDYPPAFAYFEWILSQIAQLCDPRMLEVSNLEYASPETVLFQRLSVVGGDALLLWGAWRLGGSRSAALVLCNSALLMVDHIHFQYNGMLLGLLLLSAADIEQGRTNRGAAIFCLLLSMKQIFLYVAPVYFIYLLRGHCGATFAPRINLRFWNFLSLGTVVLATCLGLFAPVLLTGQAEQLVQRLFPFGRGLTHAYWAPNVWAFYNTADRVLAKLGLGDQKGHSSTAGFAEVYESSVLWTVPPKATFALTLLAYIPLMVAMWRRTSPQNSAAQLNPGAFTLYVALGSAISFSFGWHVHEKAILMVTIPLLVAASRSTNKQLISATLALSAVATFSVMPLLPDRPVETTLKWVLFVVGYVIEAKILRLDVAPASTPGEAADAQAEGRLTNLGFGKLCPGWLVALAYFGLGIYSDFGGHRMVFRGGMEFLPLLLTSDFSAMLVLASFLRIFMLLP